jgi:hypothetical protein
VEVERGVVVVLHSGGKRDAGEVRAGTSKLLGWPKRSKLAHAFLWEYRYKRLKLPNFWVGFSPEAPRRFRRAAARLRERREEVEAPRVRLHCRFRNRRTKSVTDSGMKLTSGGTKRPCDRAPETPLEVAEAGGALDAERVPPYHPRAFRLVDDRREPARAMPTPWNVTWSQEIFSIGIDSSKYFWGPKNSSWGSESRGEP